MANYPPRWRIGAQIGKLKGALDAYEAVAAFGLVLGLWLAVIDRKPFSHGLDICGLASRSPSRRVVLQSLSLLIQFGFEVARIAGKMILPPAPDHRIGALKRLGWGSRSRRD